MAASAYRISDAEWRVMRVLWDQAPLTAAKVIEALKADTGWSPKTIHTLLGRLVKKKILGVNKEAAFYEYYPLVSKEDCVREETRSLIQRVYDGSRQLFLANFLKEEHLSPGEIAELRRLLDEKAKDIERQGG